MPRRCAFSVPVSLNRRCRFYGRLIEANPKIAEVHYQIGRIFTQANQARRALPHLKAAANLRPGEVSVWQALAEAVALSGVAEEETTFLKVVKSAPLQPKDRIALQDRFGPQRAQSWVGSGGADPKTVGDLVALMGAQRFADAERGAAALLKAHPKSAVAANILATAQAAQGRIEPAIASYRAALAINPDYAEAHDNFGQMLLRLRRVEESITHFRRAVALAPGMVSALSNLGSALSKNGDAQAALPYLKKALEQVPDYYPALIGLGNVHTKLHQHDKAEELLERAVANTGGKNAESLAFLGQTQSRLGKDDIAMENIDRALAMAPDLAGAVGGKAGLLQSFGRFDEAETYFRKVIELDPSNGDNYRLMLASYKVKPGDPLIDKMVALHDDAASPNQDRMNVSFALAKALEDIRDYGRVFHYLDEANRLTRKAYPYDIKELFAEVEAATRVQSGFDWHAARIEGTTDYAPIFITGMPRSGTTLVEQIVSSHSRLTAAGEVGDGAREAHKLLMPKAGERPLGTIPGSEIAAFGHGYEANLRAKFPDAVQITDKSIQTYMYIGLVRLAMPNARIIVVRRDPRDTLLSIYKNKFPEGTHLYAYDQRDLARYYATFVEMIDFWRAQVPDWFYEVQYEDSGRRPRGAVAQADRGLRAGVGGTVPELSPQRAQDRDAERLSGPPADLESLGQGLEALRGRPAPDARDAGRAWLLN